MSYVKIVIGEVERAVIRDVYEFQKQRNFRFGKNKWYVIRDVGSAFGVRYRVVGDVVERLVSGGILRVKEKYGHQYLFLTDVGKRLAVEWFGSVFDKLKLDALEKKIGRVKIVYREDDYWEVSDFIHGWLKAHSVDVSDVRWSDEASNYLDYRVSCIDGPWDVMKQMYDDAKKSLGGVAENVYFIDGVDLAEYIDIEEMRIGYAISDMDGTNDYRWRTQKHLRL